MLLLNLLSCIVIFGVSYVPAYILYLLVFFTNYACKIIYYFNILFQFTFVYAQDVDEFGNVVFYNVASAFKVCRSQEELLSIIKCLFQILVLLKQVKKKCVLINYLFK